MMGRTIIALAIFLHASFSSANRCEGFLGSLHVETMRQQIQELIDSNGRLGTRDLLQARRILNDPATTREKMEVFLTELRQSAELAKETPAYLLEPPSSPRRPWVLVVESAKIFAHRASEHSKLILRMLLISAAATPILYLLKENVTVAGQQLSAYLPASASGIFLGSLAVFATVHAARGLASVAGTVLGAGLAPAISDVRRRYFSAIVGGRSIPVELQALFRLTWWHSNKVLSEVDAIARGNTVEIMRATMSELTKAVGDYRRNSSEVIESQTAYAELVTRTAKFFNRSVHLFPEYFSNIEGLPHRYRHQLELNHLSSREVQELQAQLSRSNFVIVDMLQAAFSYLKLSGEGVPWEAAMRERFQFAEDVMRVATRLPDVWQGHSIPAIPATEVTRLTNILKLGLLTYDVSQIRGLLEGGPFQGNQSSYFMDWLQQRIDLRTLVALRPPTRTSAG